MGLLSFLAGPVAEVLRLIGRSFREWSEWSVREPRAAAHQLRLIAQVIEQRGLHRRNPEGVLARRDARLAAALRAQARELVAAASAEALRQVCAVKPGAWVVPEGSSTS